MTDIEWAEPPFKPRRRTDWQAIAEQLRSNPGRWAKVKSNGSTAESHSIKTGANAAFRPAGAFEASSAKTETGHDIYARYVGEVSA